MTCDDVFDVLTRGPFPSGGLEDHAVELHLRRCPECHRLAVALRPAVELFQEAVGPEESSTLPGYRGMAGSANDGSIAADANSGYWGRTDAVAQAERAFAPAPRVARVMPARGSLLKFAAAVLLGVAAAAGSRGWIERHSAPAEAPPPAAPQIASDARESNRLWLASIQLPPACVRHRFAKVAESGADSANTIQLAAVEGNYLSCCTDCHASSTTGLLSPESRSVVARACTACH
ncbi:MAG TPA: hypothetical protein VGJ26_15850 [Pirellulales bacterium]